MTPPGLPAPAVSPLPLLLTTVLNSVLTIWLGALANAPSPTLPDIVELVRLTAPPEYMPPPSPGVPPRIWKS